MTEQTSSTTESTEVTTEASSVETQSTETQSSEQADTTQNDATVTDSLAIESKEESETSSDSQPSLDDIVNEALGGELSEETKKLIEDNGMGKHIDMLVAGHQAIQEKNNQEIFSIVGGKESYNELAEWARDNLEKTQQDTVNEALFSGDMNLAKLAIQGLQAQYVQANGKAPDRVIEGGGTVNADNRPFDSVNDYIRETQHIDYKHNPEHRAKVEARRNKSGF